MVKSTCILLQFQAQKLGSLAQKHTPMMLPSFSIAYSEITQVNMNLGSPSIDKIKAIFRTVATLANLTHPQPFSPRFTEREGRKFSSSSLLRTTINVSEARVQRSVGYSYIVKIISPIVIVDRGYRLKKSRATSRLPLISYVSLALH